MTSHKLLIVDGDPGTRLSVRGYLLARGFRIEDAPSAVVALERFASFEPSAVLVADDLAGDPLALAAELKRRAPSTTVILTGSGAIDRTVRAIRHADGYVSRPVNAAALHDLILRRAPRKATSFALKAVASATFFEFESEAMRRLEEQVERVVAADCNALVVGDAGTGKKRLARHLQERSRRANKPFVEVGCAGLTRELFEGGKDRTRGLLEMAAGGTLVLDGVDQLDPTVQRALLAAIEARAHDVRILSTTRRDVDATASLRREVYYRLATVTLGVPRLRDRPEDVLPLARRLVTSLCAESRRELPVLAPDAERVLRTHTWPGNVRELKDVLSRALDRGAGHTITRGDVVIGERPTLIPRSRQFRLEIAK